MSWRDDYLATREDRAVLRMLFTWGLFYGCDEVGTRGRYCYEFVEDALAALETWNGTGHPPGPWIKHKGRGVEELNPSFGKDLV